MSVLTPAAEIPWVVTRPFRMRPGLSRLVAAHDMPEASPPLFVRDPQASAYAHHKRLSLQLHRARCQIGEADTAVLRAIANAYEWQTGVALEADANGLTEGMQEDYVVLHDEDEGMRTRFLSVCFPSNWAPAKKMGLDFAAIHAPVADNALLQAGGKAIIDMAFRQASMLRHVWLLTPNDDLAQHPETRCTRWEDAVAAADVPSASGRLLDQVFFRVERQTTLPLPALRRGVFFIRVMIAPLADVLAVGSERPFDMLEALRSMSGAVVAYRGMTAVHERLCEELRLS
jgi:hypothetical protein